MWCYQRRMQKSEGAEQASCAAVRVLLAGCAPFRTMWAAGPSTTSISLQFNRQPENTMSLLYRRRYLLLGGFRSEELENEINEQKAITQTNIHQTVIYLSFIKAHFTHVLAVTRAGVSLVVNTREPLKAFRAHMLVFHLFSLMPEIQSCSRKNEISGILVTSLLLEAAWG